MVGLLADEFYTASWTLLGLYYSILEVVQIIGRGAIDNDLRLEVEAWTDIRINGRIYQVEVRDLHVVCSTIQDICVDGCSEDGLRQTAQAVIRIRGSNTYSVFGFENSSGVSGSRRTIECLFGRSIRESCGNERPFTSYEKVVVLDSASVKSDTNPAKL